MDKTQSKKAFLILSDMEGVSGIADFRLLPTGGRFWQNYGRYLLTEDINAVASAIYAAGIRKIYLSENHNFGRNAVLEELIPFIEVLPPHSANTKLWEVSFWDEFYKDKGIIGAIIVGFPSMAGAGGYLSHSWDSKVFEYIKINGEEYGTIGTTAALLGEYRIPLIAVIGDNGIVEEVKKIDPNITAVVVKKVNGDWIEMLPPNVAHDLIYKKVLKALENLTIIKPFKIKGPVKLEFKLKDDRYIKIIKGKKEIKVDGRVVIINAPTYIEAYSIFWDFYLEIIFGKKVFFK